MLSLREHADAIPELGHGGRRIADLLVSLASRVRPGESIIDIGPYLGSTTAYLALGAPAGTPIHAFDTWDANSIDLRAKALQYHGMTVPDDLLPLYQKNVEPFAANVIVHRGDVNDFEWSGGPIGLLVDDYGVAAETTAAKMRAMAPYFVRGAQLVLMDFFWYERKSGAEFTGLRDYMRRNAARFRFVRRAGKVAAVFEVL
jgi:hypothetical protein